MMKAIATAPDAKTKYATLTSEEATERQAEEARYLVEKPMTEWQEEMAQTDDEIPRYVEDIIDALDAPTQARIDSVTRDRYLAKKTLRRTRPT